MAGPKRRRYGVGMSFESFQALIPVLCAACVLAGVMLDRRLRARWSTAAAEADADESFAMRLLADSLIRSLDLRPECRDALVTELRRERELVSAWLLRDAAVGDRAAD